MIKLIGIISTMLFLSVSSFASSGWYITVTNKAGGNISFKQAGVDYFSWDPNLIANTTIPETGKAVLYGESYGGVFHPAIGGLDVYQDGTIIDHLEVSDLHHETSAYNYYLNKNKYGHETENYCLAGEEDGRIWLDELSVTPKTSSYTAHLNVTII